VPAALIWATKASVPPEFTVAFGQVHPATGRSAEAVEPVTTMNWVDSVMP
jgi:hypothetical protein